MSETPREIAARLGIRTNGTDIDIETGKRIAPEPLDPRFMGAGTSEHNHTGERGE